MNSPWVTIAITRSRTVRRAALRGSDQRISGTDQIVDHQRRGTFDVADEKVAGNDPGAAMFLGKSHPDGVPGHALQLLPEQLRTLGPPGVGRDHA